jgi:xylulokinase
MFLKSPFRKKPCSSYGATIELYNTDGSQGAARAAAIGAGNIFLFRGGFGTLDSCKRIEPDERSVSPGRGYIKWLDLLKKQTGICNLRVNLCSA